MRAIVDFLAGRSNKLLRDMLAASALAAIACIGAATLIRSTIDGMRVARQPLPASREANRSPTGPTYGPIVTITRSVLDDPVVTGSVPGRPAAADPRAPKDRK